MKTKPRLIIKLDSRYVPRWYLNTFPPSETLEKIISTRLYNIGFDRYLLLFQFSENLSKAAEHQFVLQDEEMN